jgi:hypothetical protein
MAVSIGGVNVVESIIQLEHQLLKLSKIVEWIANNNANINVPNSELIQQFDEEALMQLKQKYPDAGVGRQ